MDSAKTVSMCTHTNKQSTQIKIKEKQNNMQHIMHVKKQTHRLGRNENSLAEFKLQQGIYNRQRMLIKLFLSLWSHSEHSFARKCFLFAALSGVGGLICSCNKKSQGFGMRSFLRGAL